MLCGGRTAVGVAIAINVATMRNTANINEGADVTADGVTAKALMKDVSGDTTSTFEAKATSGASGGDTGVAGSFALNIQNTTSEAAFKTGTTPAQVDAGSGGLARIA